VGIAVVGSISRVHERGSGRTYTYSVLELDATELEGSEELRDLVATIMHANRCSSTGVLLRGEVRDLFMLVTRALI
jgi:hypothetical protein